MEVLQGKIHQGDERFAENQQGKQCTAMAAVACCALLKWGPKECTSALLDDWVIIGDKLYGESIASLSSPPQSGYLRPDELLSVAPFTIPISFHVNMCDALYGSLYGNEYSASLVQTMNEVFARHRAAILITADYSIGLYLCSDELLWIFDSHCRGPTGLPSDKGAAVLIKIGKKTDVLKHVFNLYGERDRQFELFPIELVDVNDNPDIQLTQPLEVEYNPFFSDCLSMGMGPEYLLGYPMPQSMIDLFQSQGVQEPPAAIRSYASVVSEGHRNNFLGSMTVSSKSVWAYWRNSRGLSPTASDISLPMSLDYLDEASRSEGSDHADRQVDSVSMFQSAELEESETEGGGWCQQRHQRRKLKRNAQREERSKAQHSASPPAKRRLDQKSKKRLRKQKQRENMRLLRQDEQHSKKESAKNANRMAMKRSCDPAYRLNEANKNRRRMTEVRLDPQYVKHEGEATRQRMKNVRQIPDYAVQETTANNRRMKELRQNLDYAAKETEANITRMKHIRENPDYAAKEIEANITRMKHIRQNPDYAAKEIEANITRMKELRQNPDYAAKEIEANITRMKHIRENPDYAAKEIEANITRMKELRQNPDYAAKEIEANITRMKELRQNPDYAAKEIEANIARMKELRQNPDYAGRENEANITRLKEVRQNPDYTAKECEANITRLRHLRQYDDYAADERLSNACRMRQNRQDESFLARNRAAEAQRRLNSDLYAEKRQKFLELLKQGCTHICSCCGQLWYRKSVVIETADVLNRRNIMPGWTEVCEHRNPDSDTYTLCRTCRKYLIGKKIVPPMYGVSFPDIPEELQGLNELEERLVSARHLFMKIRTLGVGRQLGLSGSCVNVPVDVNTSVSALPRQAEDHNTVFVEVMRRMRDQRPYVFDAVRPNVVFRAARYLTQQPIYRKHNIALDENWLRQFMEALQLSQEERANEPEPMEICDESEENHVPQEQPVDEYDLLIAMLLSQDEVVEDAPAEEQPQPQPQPNVRQEDDWDERSPEERLQDQQQSLLDDVYLPDPSTGVRIAPGENRIPVSLLFDKDIEELAFPTIYCGQERSLIRTLSMAQVAKAEARLQDRRCATNTTKMFVTFCRLRRNKLSARVSMAIRKKRASQGLTARQVLDNACMNNLVQHNEGYRVLMVDRSSPAFWEGKKRTVFAMVRQFGVPTLFVTFSCAESRWLYLIVILKQTVDGVTITVEEAAQLHPEEKNRLVQSDPYTVARYCNERFQNMWNLIHTRGGPHHPYHVTHHYVRVEFQHRGSVHFHILEWVEGAPVYDPADPLSEARVVEFIDEFITCRLDPELGDLVNVQFHKHRPSCRRVLRGKRVCKYGVPFPPMRKTLILHPLDSSQYTEAEVRNLRAKYLELQARILELYKDRETQTLSFDEFLNTIGCEEDEYLRIIQSQLHKPKVYLRRELIEVKVNPYNKEMLILNDANMDVQYILDAYACGTYVVDYVNKTPRGLSEAIRQTAEAVREGNTGLAEQLRAISNVFINKSEVSAQEVAFHNLSMPLSRCSEAEVYINTSPPEQRTRLLKSQRELEDMDPESGEVFTVGLLEHYVQRPDELEDCCLADWAAWFEYSKSKRTRHNQAQRQAEDHDDVDDDADEGEASEDGEELSASNVYALKDKSGFVRKRTKPKVIRFRNYSAAKDLDNFMREQVMLFTSWTCEESFSSNATSIYLNKSDLINKNRRNYVKTDIDFNEVLEEIARNHPQEPQEDEDSEDVPNFAVYEMEAGMEADIALDVGPDCGTVNAVQSERFLLPRHEPQEEYLANLAKLNDKQRRYHDNLIHIMKTDPRRQALHYVSGGAGVGKSMLIRVLTQSVIRVHVQQGGHPDDLSVVLMTPTGKAAFLIGGVTIHAGLHLFSQNLDMRLSADVLNTLRAQLLHARLIIIDEISMVGRRLFEAVNNRLQQIFCSQEVMGGVSVLVLGDLNQLRPVLDQWVFEPASDDLSLLAGLGIWQRFKLYELTQIMRQRDDASFAEALNRLAVGSSTAEDDALFASREVDVLAAQGIHEPEDAIHLFERNKDVEEFNNIYLNSLSTESCESIAKDICEGNGPEASKRRQLERFKTLKLSETQGLPHVLVGKVSAPYMLTVNVNTQDGLTNGAMGTLMRIVWGRTADQQRLPLRLYLLFDLQAVGRQTRTDSRDMMRRDGADSIWTPVERVARSTVPSKGCLFKIVRKQFPLVPAKASSFHKVQGSTTSNVVLHMRTSVKGQWLRMDRRIMYVGCSRVPSVQGLYIAVKYQRPRPPQPGDAVVQELERLRQPENQLSFTLQFPELNVQADSLIALFHNVRSLHKHHSHVMNNGSYMAADIIMLCETWTLPEDDIELPGYTVMHRRDCEGRRHAYVTVLYVRDSLSASVQVVFNEDSLKYFRGSNLQSFVNVVAFLLKNENDESKAITFLHKSPRCAASNFEKQFNRSITKLFEHDVDKRIVFGDFNVNIQNTDSQIGRFKQFMTAQLLSLCIDPQNVSTDNCTLIDLCYSNITGLHCFFGESMISDHKPLWCQISWN